MPSGSQVSRSFSECTARSILPDERLFYLFGEQALATDFSEQAVLYPVASCADADDLDCPRRGESGVGCGQGTGDKSGLL